MKTAFVLSGGGSLGAVQVGMLQALADLEVTPDLLVGTSAGALNAGYLAGHGTDRASVDNLAEVWQRLRTLELFAPDLQRVGLALAGREDSLFSDRALRRLIKRHLKFTDLKDAPIPLWVVATDLLTGAEVHRNHGPALELIAASSAIPGIYPPVHLDGEVLVDGSLANDSAISVALNNGAERVYVLPTGYPCALRKAPRSAAGVAVQGASVLAHQRMHRDVIQYADKCDLIVIPPPCPLSVSPLDFGHGEELIDEAFTTATKWLAKDGGHRKDPARWLAVHKHH